MKLHDKKTEQNPTLTRLTQFIQTSLYRSVIQLTRNTFRARAKLNFFWCNNFPTSFVVSNQNSLVMIQILFPISTGKTDLCCCMNYFRKRPVLLLPLLHAIKNCSRSHAQFSLMWYLSQTFLLCILLSTTSFV